MLVILQLSTLVWVFDGHVLGYLMGTYVLPTPFPWWLGVETISTPLYPLSMKTCLIIFNNNSPPKNPVQFSLSLIKTPQDILPFPVLDSWRRIIFPAVLIHNTTGYKCPSLRTVIWVAHNNSIFWAPTSAAWRFLNLIHSPSSSRWYSKRNFSVNSCPCWIKKHN